MAANEKDIRCTSIVSANNLVGAEHYVVDWAGAKTANNTQVPAGVVRRGRANNLASEIITAGSCMAYVTLGASQSVAIGTKLSAGANGCFEVAGNTTYVAAVSLEANNKANNTHLLNVRVRP